MVVATIPTKDFFDALGKEMSQEELRQALFDMGMELDAYNLEELSVEITPERLDLLSAQGLARAIKQFLGMHHEFLQYEVHHSEDYTVRVSANMRTVRPYTVCAVVKNLHLTTDRIATIIELQEKLHATLGRKRKRGAIGLYPMEKITWPITFTCAHPENIIFLPLESEKELSAKELLVQHPTGKEYAHLLEGFEHYPYFKDAAGNVLSVPPIINSQTTGRVTTTTTDVFIECSGFELKVLNELLLYLTTTLADMGGELYAVRVRYEGEQELITPDFTPQKTRFRPSEVQEKIGINLPEQEIESLLRRMMHEVVQKDDDGTWIVKTPRFRHDIWHEIDLVDDVARAYGYNNIPQVVPQVHSVGTTLPLSDLAEEFSDVLVGMGYLETFTFALTGKQEQLSNMLLDEQKVNFIPVVNGNENQSMLRISLLPQQLQLLSNNRNRPLPQKIFETGFVVIPDTSKDVLSRNELHCSALLTNKVVSFTEIRQVLDSLLRTRGLEATVKTGSHPSFLPGRVGTVFVGGVPVGIVGELHPQVLVNFGLQTPVAAFEINLEKLL